MGNTTILTDDRRFNGTGLSAFRQYDGFFGSLGFFDQGIAKSRRGEFAVVVTLTKSGFDPVQIQMRGDKIGDFTGASGIICGDFMADVVKFDDSIKAVSVNQHHRNPRF